MSTRVRADTQNYLHRLFQNVYYAIIVSIDDDDGIYDNVDDKINQQLLVRGQWRDERWDRRGNSPFFNFTLQKLI